MYLIFVLGFGFNLKSPKFGKKSRNNLTCAFTALISIAAMISHNIIIPNGRLECSLDDGINTVILFIVCASIFNTSVIILAINLNNQNDV